MSDQFNQPSATPSPPRQRSWFARHKILTGLGALLVLIIIVAVANSGGEPTTTTQPGSQTSGATATDTPTTQGTPSGEGSAAPAQPARPTAAGIGDPVRDGSFEFVVTAVKPGPAIIGSEDFGAKPQGQFLLATVKVTNIGNEPQTLFGDNQYLYAGERKFSADSEAAIYLKDSQSLLEEINPGNTLTGTLVYDVPKGTSPTHIELHDSAFSGGVTVTLE